MLGTLTIAGGVATAYLVRAWLRRCERAAVARVLDAAVYIAHRHRDHTVRSTSPAEPYINHNLRVALTLATAGAPLRSIVAGMLHNTIIDTRDKQADLQEAFDAKTAAVVAEVYDENAQPNTAVELGREARLVLLADNMDNLMDLVRDTQPGWDSKRVRKSFISANQVVDSIRGTHATLEKAYDDVLRLRGTAVEKAMKNKMT